MAEEKDPANPRIDLFVDEDGKHRWRYWRSSDVVGASSQGYADRGDRDDNLCEVMGGQLAGQMLLRLVLNPLSLSLDSQEIPVREVPRG